MSSCCKFQYAGVKIFDRRYVVGKGFEVIDMQMPENSVGISNGWVIIEDKKGNIIESTFDDAEYHSDNNSTRLVPFPKSFCDLLICLPM